MAAVQVALIVTPQSSLGDESVGALVFTDLRSILVSASASLGVTVTIGDGIVRFGMCL